MASSFTWRCLDWILGKTSLHRGGQALEQARTGKVVESPSLEVFQRGVDLPPALKN